MFFKGLDNKSAYCSISSVPNNYFEYKSVAVLVRCSSQGIDRALVASATNDLSLTTLGSQNILIQNFVITTFH